MDENVEASLGQRPCICNKNMDRESKNPEPKTFNKLLHEFAGYSTAHGLNRLVESPGIFRKLIWMAFCAGALTMFLFQFYGLVQLYLRRPVSTTLTVAHQEGFKFPAVTICNHNMVRKSMVSATLSAELGLRETTTQAEKSNGTQTQRPWESDGAIDGLDDEGSSIGEDSCFYDPDSDSCDEDSDMGEVKKDFKVQESITYKLSQLDREELSILGHQFYDFIRDCTFKGFDCLNFTRYWNQHWNYRYGNCFTFNSGFDNEGKKVFVKEVHKTGPAHGLTLTLNTEEYEYIAELSEYVGARIAILPQQQMPFPDDEGISVMPGRVTFIGLRKEEIKRVDPFGNGSCKENRILPPSNIYSSRNNTHYSLQLCMKSCLAEKQEDACKCAEVQFQSPNTTVCDTADFDTENCLKKVKKNFQLGDLKCDVECPVPCTEEFFKATMSSSKWPSKPVEKIMIKELKDLNFNMVNTSISDFLQVKIYFEQLNFQRITESVYYKELNLAADIGGQLGLWIGVSVLTVCEFIEFAFVLMQFIFDKIRVRGTVTHTTSTELGNTA